MYPTTRLRHPTPPGSSSSSGNTTPRSDDAWDEHAPASRDEALAAFLAQLDETDRDALADELPDALDALLHKLATLPHEPADPHTGLHPEPDADLWCALLAVVRDMPVHGHEPAHIERASTRIHALATAMAKAGVEDDAAWDALVDCAVQQHGPGADAAHAARMGLATHLATLLSGTSVPQAWAAIVRSAPGMNDTRFDALMRVFYRAGPGLGTIMTVAFELPEQSRLVTHMLSLAPALPHGMLTRLAQFVHSTQTHKHVLKALADMDDTLREDALRAMQACVLMPDMGLRRPEDIASHAPSALTAWLGLARRMHGMLPGSMPAVSRLTMVISFQADWSAPEQVDLLLSSLRACALGNHQWAEVIHRLPDDAPKLLARFAATLLDSGEGGRDAWNALGQKVEGLVPQGKQALRDILRASPAPGDDDTRDCAVRYRKLQDHLRHGLDPLKQASRMSGAEWARQQDTILAQLVPDAPMSGARARAVCDLLVHRNVTDPLVWARLLRKTPEDDFFHAATLLDLAGRFLARHELNHHAALTGPLDRLAGIVQAQAARQLLDDLAFQLHAMTQTLAPQAYAACLAAMMKSSDPQALQAVIKATDRLCRVCPHALLPGWDSYRAAVIASGDIGLSTRCLKQARALIGADNGRGEFTAHRLGVGALEAALAAQLKSLRGELSAETAVLVMETMDPATQAGEIRQLLRRMLATPAPASLAGHVTVGLVKRSITLLHSVQEAGGPQEQHAGPSVVDCVRWWVEAGHFARVMHTLGEQPALLDGPTTHYLCEHTAGSLPNTTTWLSHLSTVLSQIKPGSAQAVAIAREAVPHVVGLVSGLPRDAILGSGTLQWLGPLNLVGMVRTVNTPATGLYLPVMGHILRNLVATGRMELDSIAAVRHHRAGLKARAPQVLWDRVFHPGRHRDTPVLEFRTAGARASQATRGALGAIHTLARDLLGWAEQARKSGLYPVHRSGELLLVHQHVKPLLCLLAKCDTATARRAARALWGADWAKSQGWREIKPDRRLAKTLCSRKFATLCDELDKALGSLPADVAGVAGQLREQLATIGVRLGELRAFQHLPGTGTMDSSASYRVTLSDPDDPAMLLTCQTTGGCLQPGNSQFPHLLERLAGWIVWTARDDRGVTCAVAWGVLNGQRELVVDFIDATRTGEPAVASELVQTLLDYAPMVAQHLGITGPVWVGPPQYNRLNGLEVFKRPVESRAFTSLMPSLMQSAAEVDPPDPTPEDKENAPPVKVEPLDYSDAVNRGTKSYFRV